MIISKNFIPPIFKKPFHQFLFRGRLTYLSHKIGNQIEQRTIDFMARAHNKVYGIFSFRILSYNFLFIVVSILLSVAQLGNLRRQLDSINRFILRFARVEQIIIIIPTLLNVTWTNCLIKPRFRTDLKRARPRLLNSKEF